MYSVRLARLLLSVLILSVLVLTGCQRAQRAPEAGSEEDDNVQIALQPLYPEETLIVMLTDATGAPITDATVEVEGNMNHAGMVPVLPDPVTDEADGSADGRYTLPFTFTMLGDWIITVNVTRADGNSVSRNLEVRASNEGIEGDDVVPMEGHAPEESETSASAIGVHNAMARPAPLAGGTGAVYFTLHNGSDATVTFTGAESPAASAIELHTTINDNGVLRMRQLEDGIEIAAHEMVELTPGAMHLMLVDLAAPLVEGENIELTLYFTGAESVTLVVPVMNMDDLPAEGEMEHDH